MNAKTKLRLVISTTGRISPLGTDSIPPALLIEGKPGLDKKVRLVALRARQTVKDDLARRTTARK